MKKAKPLKSLAKKNKDEYSGTIDNIWLMMKIIFKASPGRVISTFVQYLMSYASWAFFSIIFMRYVFNSMDQNKSFFSIVLFISLSMAAFLLFELFMAWYSDRYNPLTDQVIYYKISRMIFDKSTSVDISCYENPDFYNSYTKAISEVNTRAIAVLESISMLVVSVISSLYVVATMYQIDKLMAVCTIFPVVSSFFFGKLIRKVSYDNEMDDVPFNRRMEYVNRTVFLRKYAKEMRLSNIFKVLEVLYLKAYDGILRNVDKYKSKHFRLSIISEVICYPVVFERVWLYATFITIVLKNLSIADCVILANAMVMATHSLLNIMKGIVGVFENGMYVKNLRTFLDYKEKIPEDQDGLPIDREILTFEFKNDTFKYDGQETPILKNISFKLNMNEKIALVGHNGAGKTTIVKLMMRLYDPVEGEILLNGINIKEFNLKAYRRLFATVFQDFQIMSMSALENVSMSEILNNTHRETILEAMKKSGVLEKLISLKNGVDTTLTREFDDEGAVLSGGEQQKLAISRVFVRDNRIAILDEPSSALDPIAEYRMYETLAETFGNEERPRMVVLISHRLSSSVLADQIYVLENGEILESGTYKELMDLNGKYADMFRKQAKYYLEDAGEGEWEEAIS